MKSAPENGRIRPKSSRNQTLACSAVELERYTKSLLQLSRPAGLEALENNIINQDFITAAQYLPECFVDLLVLDPPYNISKNYHGHLFNEMSVEQYGVWFSGMIKALKPSLKPEATIYVCSDWKTSMEIAPILNREFTIRNRITWEREKGRGAKSNWKNNTEDIWFCTNSNDFKFNVESVRLKRKVIAPYRTPNGTPKDWEEGESGKFRLTYPSNIWTDITIPFWSMPENTNHPTQKPEKLIAKLILASSSENDFILDPFLGSGTTAVVCKKLSRRFLGIEQNTDYCCWAKKRLEHASKNTAIQGYSNAVFWERNSQPPRT